MFFYAVTVWVFVVALQKSYLIGKAVALKHSDTIDRK